MGLALLKMGLFVSAVKVNTFLEDDDENNNDES